MLNDSDDNDKGCVIYIGIMINENNYHGQSRSQHIYKIIKGRSWSYQNVINDQKSPIGPKLLYIKSE